MTASLVGAVLALALLTVLPGPDVAVVTRLALSRGRSEALRGSCGVAAGLLVWGLLTVAGLSALLAASATAYAVVKYAGAAYLVVLGVRALLQSRSVTTEPQPTVGGGLRTGLVGNLLNPKIAVFYTGLLPSLVPDGAPHALTLVGLVLVHVVLTLAWLVTCTALLLRASTALQRPRARQSLERLTGAALIGFGVRVALAGEH